MHVGDQRHLAQKLHGVSAKQKEHLQGALNGARAVLGFSPSCMHLACCASLLVATLGEG